MTMVIKFVMKRTPASVSCAAVVGIVVILTGPAARATMTEQIDAPGAALTGFTGPYVTVSIGRVDGQTFSKSDSGVDFLGNLDGFGNVNLNLDSGSGFPDAANLVGFLITRTTGLWTSDAAVLMNNAGGYSAAIRAFACTAPCTRPAGALATGVLGR